MFLAVVLTPPFGENKTIMKLRTLFLTAFAALAFTATHANATCVANYLIPSSTLATSSGTTVYSYSIVAGCVPSVQFDEFFVPYFSDAGISNITVPAGWGYTITSSDLFGLGSGAGALEFIPNSPLTGETYGQTTTGISFTSPYAPINGPLGVTSQYPGSGGPVTTISDPPVPGSPEAIAALSGVPEPATKTLMLLGVIAVVGFGLTKR